MKPVLVFNIRNQNISRVDNFIPVRNSVNYLYAEFNFKTDDWNGRNKTAVFEADDGNRYPVILGETNTCIVPWEVLEGLSFKVSVFGGDLITSDSVDIKLYEAGYKDTDTKEPTPGVYDQLLTKLDKKADGIAIDGNMVRLYSGSEIIYESSFNVDGGTFADWHKEG